MVRSPKTKPEYMWAIALIALITGVGAFSSGFDVARNSQLAVGVEADMECVSGSKYDPKEKFPKKTKQGKTGLIGKPCKDVTNGGVTEGKCQAEAKCKGEKTGGMMPMLPMLPMPMPKMMMPMMMMPMQPDCTQSQNTPQTTSTTSSSTPAKASDPNCPPSASGNSGWFSSIFGGGSTDSTGGTSGSGDSSSSGGSSSNSAWSNLLNSLGLGGSSSGSSGTTNNSESTGSNGTASTGGLKGKDVAALGSNAGVQAGTTKTGGAVAVTNDFAIGQSESTFSYQAPPPTNETAGILANITAALQNLLRIVNSWI